MSRFETNEPRVRTTEELQRDYDKIETVMNQEKLERTALSQSINQKKKQLAELQELIDNNNQINLFPNE